ncbi:MAG: response regulator [Halieaceae bacterium]|uniref:response regulator n=1 Tax=Haliea alexandrii TaxID=2448162 RepID=UPI000F0B087E|nr:HD domain-containing phosphohydrolase [Haliea alexandrii]MCR9185898.1 response regulator [Halieaceae bacterium]
MHVNNGPLLIVDDEPQNLAAMRQVLEGEYPLVYARNGAGALEAVAKHAPSMILLDIQMPDMDGITVCRRLKESPVSASIPIIFVTALSADFDEAAGFAAGAVDYLTKPISPAIVRARVRTHLSLVTAAKLEESYNESIFMLAAAGEFKDTETGVHIWRMAAYAKALADTIGWSEELSKRLRLAAPMHDMGKIGIPDAILRKPGKLDADEWGVMQRHCEIGHEILCKGCSPVMAMAAEIALCHHERWDGTGYPRKLQGSAIPESARIVALADVFDALTMDRPYKTAWPIERAVEAMLAERGKHFEPRLLDAFEHILPQICEIKANWDDTHLPH